jgi:hypothetical protein
MFEFALGFMWGLIVAVGVGIAYGNYQLRKLNKVKSSLLEDLKKKSASLESIRDRLIKASELTQIQSDLRSRAEQPSRNSLDSKYKNGLIGELNRLEQEKISILKSILADGHDPQITVISAGGEKQEMLLSAYVAEVQGIVGEPEKQPLPSEDLAPGVRRVGKFIVVQGGKSDSTTH